MEQLKQFFADKKVESILDVGTGTGDFIAVLKEVVPGASLTGVDPNKESLLEATQTFPDVKFKEMYGEKLDFADNTFDVASISMALHHLPDISKTLGEMKRIVKPGGWIIINELFSDNLNSAQEVHKAMHHFRSKIDRLKGVSHNETFEKSQILQFVENAGFEIRLHFENRKAAKQLSAEDIQERSNKLTEMLEQVNHKPQYLDLKKEAEQITAALKIHGFEMATRLVIVAAVNKTQLS
ncbi:methyltransferase domain-containing protein [uncultured Draconibacterium sp.]|uniref:class I SAM-dependent methyltransferase n=1 Tax=uncultured Draconibacterium sp. TaxID=1573823 RepID=UPI003216E484